MSEIIFYLANILRVDIFVGFGFYSIIFFLIKLFLKSNKTLTAFDESAVRVMIYGGILWFLLWFIGTFVFYFELETKLDKKVNISAIHVALKRMEEKGFVKSRFGGITNDRGGRRKKFYVITAFGKQALDQQYSIRTDLYQQIPKISFS